MIPKLYKDRKVTFREAQLNLEAKYKTVTPSRWTLLQYRQMAHIIKWASVSFNLRRSVKISKTQLVNELGQRGYRQHIHSVFPLIQGHNLGKGQITVYDYRMLLKQIIKWVREMGTEAIDQFKTIFKAVLDDIEKTDRKKMGWFWKMASFWFGKFTDTFKVLVQEKNVTTIQESYKILSPTLSRSARRSRVRTSTSAQLIASDLLLRSTLARMPFSWSPSSGPSQSAS